MSDEKKLVEEVETEEVVETATTEEVKTEEPVAQEVETEEVAVEETVTEEVKTEETVAQEPVAEEVATEETEAEPTEQPQEEKTAKICSNCGTELKEEEGFCPNCGQKYEVQISSEASDAIAKFNQGIVEQSKKKTKNKKVLVIILAIVGAIALIFGGMYLVFNSTAEDIIKEMSAKDPSAKKISAQYKKLTPIGQLMFRGKIVTAFVDDVSKNVYKSDDELVNLGALVKYIDYKTAGDAIKITKKDGTNVMEHINHVLQLTDYYQYNEVKKCVVATSSDHSKGLNYMTSAIKSSSYYVMKLYMRYAYSSFYDVYSTALEYDTSDELVSAYIADIKTLKDESYDFYLYGYYSYSTYAVTDALNDITELINNISDAMSKVSDIVSSIPKITK